MSLYLSQRVLDTDKLFYRYLLEDLRKTKRFKILRYLYSLCHKGRNFVRFVESHVKTLKTKQRKVKNIFDKNFDFTPLLV